MSERLILPPVEAIDEVPFLALSGVLGHLSALVARVAGRLADEAPVGPTGPVEDYLLTIDQAAKRLATTRDWLRRRRDLPFVVLLSPGQVRYSARGIEQYLRAHGPPRRRA